MSVIALLLMLFLSHKGTLRGPKHSPALAKFRLAGPSGSVPGRFGCDAYRGTPPPPPYRGSG